MKFKSIVGGSLGDGSSQKYMSVECARDVSAQGGQKHQCHSCLTDPDFRYRHTIQFSNHIKNLRISRYLSENCEVNVLEQCVGQDDHNRQLYDGQAPASDSVGVPTQTYACIHILTRHSLPTLCTIEMKSGVSMAEDILSPQWSALYLRWFNLQYNKTSSAYFILPPKHTSETIF